MKIVVAPDSFKGSLTALEAASAIEEGVKLAMPDATIVKVPMADGGEGTLQALVDATKGTFVECMVQGPAGAPVKASYGVLGNATTAVVEMAQAAGLPLVADGAYDPMEATSYGVGELIRAVVDAGFRRVVIGLGGSATVDGGIGAMQALGFSFKDEEGSEVSSNGRGLCSLVDIDRSSSHKAIETTEFIVASDVNSPLLGEGGAVHLFGPQKGVSPDDIEELERAMERYSLLLGKGIADIRGAGAAGGLGAACFALLGAKIVVGVDLVAGEVGLARHLENADVVITGEGSVDSQTVRGKTPAGVAAWAKKKKIPVIAIGGAVPTEPDGLHACGIDALFSLSPRPITLDESKKHAKKYLSAVSRQIVHTIKIGIDHEAQLVSD
ncbi:glycerate kinase [Simkania negevensis]|uniref:Glycerate kinase n=1 Tax=Simkania negevensis TaxID=83561 RepID=A0ABS3AUI2_9BACT|nr:glycerate kinase [Simkania negevensis]